MSPERYDAVRGDLLLHRSALGTPDRWYRGRRRSAAPATASSWSSTTMPTCRPDSSGISGCRCLPRRRRPDLHIVASTPIPKGLSGARNTGMTNADQGRARLPRRRRSAASRIAGPAAFGDRVPSRSGGSRRRCHAAWEGGAPLVPRQIRLGRRLRLPRNRRLGQPGAQPDRCSNGCAPGQLVKIGGFSSDLGRVGTRYPSAAKNLMGIELRNTFPDSMVIPRQPFRRRPSGTSSPTRPSATSCPDVATRVGRSEAECDRGRAIGVLRRKRRTSPARSPVVSCATLAQLGRGDVFAPVRLVIMLLGVITTGANTVQRMVGALPYPKCAWSLRRRTTRKNPVGDRVTLIDRPGSAPPRPPNAERTTTAPAR